MKHGVAFWRSYQALICRIVQKYDQSVRSLHRTLSDSEEVTVNENGSYAQRDLFPTAQSTSPLLIFSRYSAVYRLP